MSIYTGDRVAIPLGWLPNNIIEAALLSKAALKTSLGYTNSELIVPAEMT